MNPPSSLKNRLYPKFIRNHKLIKQNPNPYKFFPRIGLKNNKEEANYLGAPKTWSVNFSSHPWDIATMSMRGISSCMRWGTSQSNSLVGSILDPYTAIIYISNNINSYYIFDYDNAAKDMVPTFINKTILIGTHMIARAVVRFVFKKRKPHKPVIFIERVYLDNKFLSYVSPVAKLFKNYLTRHTENKFEVRYSETTLTEKQNDVAMPLVKVIDRLMGKNYSWKYATYSDANLSIWDLEKYKNSKRLSLRNL